MKVYEVGGCVRDKLLGLDPKDKDYVVVGSTEQELLDKGFTRVGKKFPVFLHPQTKDEFALARTEKKISEGHTGFSVSFDPSVTLEEDLARRDLTINAIAQDSLGNLIDPYGGVEDLKKGLLRHTTEAFKEDPLRVLRVARFAARFVFSIHKKTMELMKQIVASGELETLPKERITLEFNKGLMTDNPQIFFGVLKECGALKILMPSLDRLYGVPQKAIFHPEIDTFVHTMMVLKQAAKSNYDLSVRYACLTHDLGKGTTKLEELPSHNAHEFRSSKEIEKLDLVLDNKTKELCLLNALHHTDIHKSTNLGASALWRLLKRTQAFRKPMQFSSMLEACECDAKGRLGFEDTDYPPKKFLSDLLFSCFKVDKKALAQQALGRGLTGIKIQRFIDNEIIKEIKKFLGK